jgi:hypothetical protein
MNETLTISDGTEVHFYSALSYNGINVSVDTKLSEEQYTEFKNKLRSERDVVSIRKSA